MGRFPRATLTAKKPQRSPRAVWVCVGFRRSLGNPDPTKTQSPCLRKFPPCIQAKSDAQAMQLRSVGLDRVSQCMYKYTRYVCNLFLAGGRGTPLPLRVIHRNPLDSIVDARPLRPLREISTLQSSALLFTVQTLFDC